jgi:hypothetical protein
MTTTTEPRQSPTATLSNPDRGRVALARFVTNTALALATGYVLFFFSERLFWGVFKPGDHAGELAVPWLAYSVVAYLFLSVVYCFRARSASSVFLAGAFFGWLIEGTLVGTLYGTESSAPFPLSLLVTGVSWHALISVWVGWHFLRRALHDARTRRVVAWSILLGLFWGTWTTFLWRETPPVVVPVRAFATHALAVSLLLTIAYGVIQRVGAGSFRPRPFGLCVALLGVGVFYAQQVKAMGVLPLLVLPLLLVVAAAALWRASRIARDFPETDGPRPLRAASFASLVAMPLVATAVYAGLLRAGWWDRVPVATAVMYGVTAPLSAVVLVWALAKSLLGRPHPAATETM